MITTSCAPPAEQLDVELLVLQAFGVDFPRLVWCSPETEAERAYRTRWGVADWPTFDVDLLRIDDADGSLWVRADLAAQIAAPDIETAAERS